jgi:hypothetical protein
MLILIIKVKMRCKPDLAPSAPTPAGVPRTTLKADSPL